MEKEPILAFDPFKGELQIVVGDELLIITDFIKDVREDKHLRILNKHETNKLIKKLVANI